MSLGELIYKPLDSGNEIWKAGNCMGLVVLALQVITWAWGRSETYNYIIDNIMTMGSVYSLISLMLSWCKIIALTVALVVTVRFIRTKKQRL